MSAALDREQPSTVYIFVVFSLAAFLLLFTFFRTPGITYETQVVFTQAITTEESATPDVNAEEAKAAKLLLSPTFVLDAMRQAQMMRGETNEETLGIAKRITDRMRVKTTQLNGAISTRLLLFTHHPEAATKLLDSLMQQLQTAPSYSTANISTHPAIISRQRGGSVAATDLLLLAVMSCLAGGFGLLCSGRLDSSVLRTPEDVDQLAGLPVLANFARRSADSHDGDYLVRRRAFDVAVRIAELSVAAIFLLMVYNLVTQDALMTRFANDPLAAYGEVITNLVS